MIPIKEQLYLNGLSMFIPSWFNKLIKMTISMYLAKLSEIKSIF